MDTPHHVHNHGRELLQLVKFCLIISTAAHLWIKLNLTNRFWPYATPTAKTVYLKPHDSVQRPRLFSACSGSHLGFFTIEFLSIMINLMFIIIHWLKSLTIAWIATIVTTHSIAPTWLQIFCIRFVLYRAFKLKNCLMTSRRWNLTLFIGLSKKLWCVIISLHIYKHR